jgi:hypothetical protein
MTTICPVCQGEITMGDFPFCKGDPADHGRASFATKREDYPGGIVLHNLGKEPVRVYSESQRKRIMAERGLVEAVRHVPVPGTDSSPHTTDWARGTVDLDAAAVLVTRTGSRGKDVEHTPETADKSGTSASWHSPGDVPAWVVPV